MPGCSSSIFSSTHNKAGGVTVLSKVVKPKSVLNAKVSRSNLPLQVVAFALLYACPMIAPSVAGRESSMPSPLTFCTDWAFFSQDALESIADLGDAELIKA